MFRSFRFAVLPVAFCAVAGISVLSAGCGGGNTDAVQAVAAGGTTNSVFAGRSQTGTVAIGEGQTGTLNLTVGRDGRTATGTLTVAANQTGRQAFSFAVGTYNISGTVDPVTGAFTMSGNVPGAGAFTLGGTLPTTATTGAFRLTAGGQTYTGSLPGISVAPTPTPTPTSTATPTPGGAVTIPSGYVIAASASAAGQNVLTISAYNSAGSTTALTINVVYGSSSPHTGTFPVTGDSSANNAAVVYTNGGSAYGGVSGNVVVEEISSQVRYRLDNVVLQAPNGSQITLSGSGQTTIPYVSLGSYGF